MEDSNATEREQVMRIAKEKFQGFYRACDTYLWQIIRQTKRNDNKNNNVTHERKNKRNGEKNQRNKKGDVRAGKCGLGER